MIIMHSDDDSAEVLPRVVELLTGFDEVVAVGLSGSSATGITDYLSDLDVCVFANPDIPEPKLRRQRLESGTLGKITYFDVDFQVSRGDGVSVDGKACDLNWMSVPGIVSFLESLVADFDCDEFVPGGLMKTKAVYDPDGVIERLQRAIPDYPRERVLHRIEKSISAAHFSLYVLRWLEKAAARDDYFSFLKFKHQILDNFFTALFALNRQWFCDEKRLVGKTEEFEHAPSRAKSRLAALIMHTGESGVAGRKPERTEVAVLGPGFSFKKGVS